MKEKIKRLKDFFLHEIWTINLDNLSKTKRLVIQSARLLMLSLRSFKEDKLNVNASALTYFTMLSIVPVLALGFGIAKGFGLEAVLEDELAKNLAGQEQARVYILQFTKSLLETTKGGLVAGVGIILLFWSVIKLLTNIENSFNLVWDVKKGRSFLRKFTDYTSIVMLAPIFMIVSGSLTIYISSEFAKLGQDTMFNFVSPISLTFAKFIPFILIWMLFTLLYLILPNTKVKFKSALIAGIIAGTIFQIFQGFYVNLQSGFTRINAIYGSFAALPLFLMWLQISWFVVLLGAEVSFAVQNLKLKSNSLIQENFSIEYRKKLALFIARKLIRDFENGKPAPNLQQIANETQLPIYTAEHIVKQLINAGVISKIAGKNKEYTYQPAESTNNLDLYKITEAIDRAGKDESKYLTHPEFLILSKKMKEMKRMQKKSNANILLKDISADTHPTA